MKILVIRLSSIGDVLLTTPVLRCLHEQLDNVELHFLTKKVNIPLMEDNPYIDVLHEYTSDYDSVKTLVREQFDVVVDLHRNRHSRFIRTSLWGKKYIYNKENLRKFLYILTKKNIMSGRHVVDRYLNAVSHLGVVNDNKGLDLYLSAASCCDASRLHIKHLKGHELYCVLVCGAQHHTKRIPTEGISQLCANIPLPVVLLGDENDRQRLEREGVSVQPKDVNLCGQIPLASSAAMIRDAAVVITADTGLMHVAAALRRPVVVVWGATAPPLGFTPYHTKYVDCEVPNLPCHPCSRQGGKRCRQGHFACMQQQNWHDVAAKAMDIIYKVPK